MRARRAATVRDRGLNRDSGEGSARPVGDRQGKTRIGAKPVHSLPISPQSCSMKDGMANYPP